jgi:hypothetical protein
MASWHTVDTARDEWVDAPFDADDGDTILVSLLSAAKSAVLAYAPVLDTTTWPSDTCPDGYRIGQLMQARNIWNSTKANPSGDFDGGQYGLTTFPLDWQVRQLLRPKRGIPSLA